MTSSRTDIVLRSDGIDVRDIDKGYKNCWNWSWLEKKIDGVFVQEILRKIDKPGTAYCLICSKELQYGSRGFKTLESHIQSKKHTANVKARNENFALPGASQTATQEKLHSTYGLHPMFSSGEISTEANVTKPLIPLADRVVNNEAMLLSFVAEKSLSFSLVPDLLELIKAMSLDKKALNKTMMHRTAASYKLKFGLAKTIKANIIEDLKQEMFSLNIDESTSKNNEKVVTVLVNYFKENRIVTEHLHSFTVDVVNSDSLFKGIVSMMQENSIPWENLLSVLLDSCNVMRGKKSGLEVKLREKCPHLLDIDGDSCHHAHNAAKQFTKPFELHLESLCADIHRDFKWSSDLRSALKEICSILNIKYTSPENYISFRWLSVYDVAQDLSRLMNAYILFYCSFLNKTSKIDYLHLVLKVFKEHGVKSNGRKFVKNLQEKLSSKNLTQAGKERKTRIATKLFQMNVKTKLIMNLYISILPLLKEYVKLFQCNEPMIHKLHDKQIELLRNFLACFVKPEVVCSTFKKSVKEVKSLEFDDKNILQTKFIFVGDKVKELMKSYPKCNDVLQFKKLLVKAYVGCALTLICKMPIDNMVLKSASAIDFQCRQHTISLKLLKDLPQLVTNILTSKESELYDLEVHKFQSDESLDIAEEESIACWWMRRRSKYPFLTKMALALLTCFHGPKVEGSFSIMNNVITAGSSRLNIDTFDAIQSVKYSLMAEGKSSVARYRKVDFLSEPINKNLVRNMQSSFKVYQAEKIKKREASNENLKCLVLKKNCEVSKIKAKKICSKAAKHQRLIHQKELNRRKNTLNESSPSPKRASSDGAIASISKPITDVEASADNSGVINKSITDVAAASPQVKRINKDQGRPTKKRKIASHNIVEMFQKVVSKNTNNL